MAMPRYQPGQVKLQEGVSTARQASAQGISSFVQRAEQFKGMAIERVAMSSAQRAKQDAETAFTEKGLKAEINNELTVYGQTYTNALQDLHKKKLAIGTSNQMDMIYKENENNPASFEKVSTAYYEKTLSMIPDHLKADYAVDFESNKAHYSGKVQANRIRLDKEADLAATNELIIQVNNKSTQAARDGNQNLALYELLKGEKALDSALENGTITADQHRKQLDSLKMGVSKSNFKGINDSNISSGDLPNAQEFINQFRSATVPGMNDDQREALADDMQRDLNVALKQAKAQEEAKVKDAGFVIDDAIKVLKSGKLPDNMEDVQEALQYATPKQMHDIDIEYKANRKSTAIGSLSIPDQLAVISQEEAAPDASLEDTKVLAAMKKNLQEKQALAKKDMITLGAQDGLYEPTKSLLPGIDPNTGMAVLSERMRQASLSKDNYGVPMQVFTEPEATQWVNWLNDSGTSISDKMDFIKSIETGTNGKGHIAYKQLMKDKRASVFTAAGDFYAEGRPNVSQMLLHGEMVLNSEMGASIDRKELTGKLNSALGNTFSRSTKDDRNKVISSVSAYYASLAEGYGALGDESYQYAEQAIEEVLGKQGIRNGQGYFAPMGMDADDVDDFIDDLDTTDMDNIAGIPKEAMKDVISNSKLIQVEGNKYRLIFQNHSVTKEDGTPFILEIAK